MPKKKSPELDPKEQFKRFQETAKKVEIDDSQAEKSFRSLAAGKAKQAKTRDHGGT